VFANTAKENEKEWGTRRSRCCLVRSLEGTTFAGGLRSGQLFMAECIRGGYKRRLLQTLNSPYINQTPARCAAPRESEEGDVAPHFFPTQECIIVDAVAATHSMHSTEWMRATSMKMNANDIFPMIFIYLFIFRLTGHLKIKFTQN